MIATVMSFLLGFAIGGIIAIGLLVVFFVLAFMAWTAGGSH